MNREVLWRDTALPPKIGFLDARAVFPLSIWLFHWAYWTAAIALVGIGVLFLVQRTGMTPSACFRALRLTVTGHIRETRENGVRCGLPSVGGAGGMCCEIFLAITPIFIYIARRMKVWDDLTIRDNFCS